MEKKYNALLPDPPNQRFKPYVQTHHITLNFPTPVPKYGPAHAQTNPFPVAWLRRMVWKMVRNAPPQKKKLVPTLAHVTVSLVITVPKFIRKAALRTWSRTYSLTVSIVLSLKPAYGEYCFSFVVLFVSRVVFVVIVVVVTVVVVVFFSSQISKWYCTVIWSFTIIIIPYYGVYLLLKSDYTRYFRPLQTRVYPSLSVNILCCNVIFE